MGTVLFGIVVNAEIPDAGMLQVQLAGTAPNVGGLPLCFSVGLLSLVHAQRIVRD